MFKHIKVAAIGLMILMLSLGTVYGAGKPRKETKAYVKMEEDVYIPPEKKGKVPVVFLVHNGMESKENWGDFPQQLAAEGWVVVSFTWDWAGYKQMYDINRAVAFTLKQYEAIIDPQKMAFIGGCHGGTKSLCLLGDAKLASYIKTVVTLSSPDELYPDFEKALNTAHAPILAYYSTKDRLGESYQKASQEYAEVNLTQPKTVVAVETDAHGNELVTDPDTKTKIRQEIIAWLKKYL